MPQSLDPVQGKSGNPQQPDKREQVDPLLQQLALASEAINSTLGFNEALSFVVSLAVATLRADLGLLLLVDRAGRLLRMHTCVPPQPEAVGPVVMDRRTWKMLQELVERGQRVEVNAFLQQLLPLQEHWQYRSVLTAPLLQNVQFSGLLCCYFHEDEPVLPTSQVFLDILAHVLATAHQRQRLQDVLSCSREALIKAFFDNLVQPERVSIDTLQIQAEYLECDLSKSHTVVMISIIASSDGEEDVPEEKERDRHTHFSQANAQLQRRLKQEFPGSIVYGHDTVLIGLLRTRRDAARLQKWLREFSHKVADQYHVDMSIGITNASAMLQDYRRRFAEASQALQTSLLYQEHGGVIHFDEIIIYRYLQVPEVAERLAGYMGKISRLAEYDKQRDQGRLLSTLEAFLDTGTVGKATAYLQKQQSSSISFNTVRQRLQRIQELLSIDLFGEQMTGQRFDLHLAVKAYKLHL